jgi:acetoin utilization deacetylase AcuC-like enzyme
MKILFNKKFLNHNIHSDGEGAYRLSVFPEYFGDADSDGEQFITLVHTERYRDVIKKACMNKEIAAEVQLHPASWEAAVSAVGLTVMAADQGDFAVVRPPGHHAGRERAAGFCLFNNIAIAAQKLVNEGKRVFIFDFDGHHGDGTQSVFYDTDQVLYTSTHQAFAYPFSGFPTETGSGKGEGFTMNFPLMAGNGDKEFLEALDKIISAAQKFAPDVVGVSAGFDGYYKDRLLGLKFTLKSYYECGFRLRRAFPNIFAVLEGGYHNEIKDCVESFIDGVNVGSRPVKDRFNHDMSVG